MFRLVGYKVNKQKWIALFYPSSKPLRDGNGKNNVLQSGHISPTELTTAEQEELRLMWREA